MRSMSISSSSSLVVGAVSDSSALSPRPNTLLVMSHNLLCQLKVAFRPAGTYVVQNNRFTVAGGFCQAHVPRNHRLKYLLAVEIAQIGCYRRREVSPLVIHGKQQTFSG